MGKRKEHHFVPKCYLDNFSVNSEKKLIRLYNILTQFYFEKASTADQAKEKYLYGDDDVIETKLGNIEGEAAAAINYCLHKNELPTKVQFLHLKKFILYQHIRTTKRERVIRESFTTLMNDTFGNNAPEPSVTIGEMVEMAESQIQFLDFTG